MTQEFFELIQMELSALKSICLHLDTVWFFQNIILKISIFVYFPLLSEQACFNRRFYNLFFHFSSGAKVPRTERVVSWSPAPEMFLKLSDLNEKYNLTEVRYSFITNTFHPLWDIVGKMVILPQPYDNLFESNPYHEPHFPGFPIKQSSLMGEWSVFVILKSNIFRRSAAHCIWHRQKE